MATLSSKVTPSGVASAAQGALADSAVQPADSFDAGNLINALPAISGAALTSLNSASLSGALPAIDGSNLTGVGASTTAGAVGTYAMLIRATSSSTIVEGSTYAGSDLRFSGFRAGYNAFYEAYSPGGVGGTPSGTWRAMGRTNNNSGINPVNIFVRIS